VRLEYNNLELKELKDIYMDVPSVPNFMDISLVDQAIVIID
jgi:hypothetical protein